MEEGKSSIRPNRSGDFIREIERRASLLFRHSGAVMGQGDSQNPD
jgi:hypothetical protein